MALIIAEAGVNHNGDESLALRLIDAAVEAGADIVKFQTFKSTKLVTSSATQADYQVINTKKKESQLAMLSRLELSHEFHYELVKYCNKFDIEFLSTAFDSESLNFLVNDLKLQKLKISSGDLTNAPFLLEHARTGCNLIISSGMSTLAEIEMALGVIAFGYVRKKTDTPSIQAFEEAYCSDIGQKMLKDKVTILHCTTEYPAPVKDINLKAMKTLNNAFKISVGYSDHSAGIHIPIAAAALGAQVIEKHFTLDKNMQGPDHKASLEPEELAEMVKGIRDIELSLGNGLKAPRPSESKNKIVARKSLVAAKPIKIGDIYSSDNLTIKRPGNGSSPFLYWELLGKEALSNHDEGEVILV